MRTEEWHIHRRCLSEWCGKNYHYRINQNRLGCSEVKTDKIWKSQWLKTTNYFWLTLCICCVLALVSTLHCPGSGAPFEQETTVWNTANHPKSAERAWWIAYWLLKVPPESYTSFLLTLYCQSKSKATDNCRGMRKYNTTVSWGR